jgi:prefoldin subunit 5
MYSVSIEQLNRMKSTLAKMRRIKFEVEECKVILERLKDDSADKTLLMSMLQNRITDIEQNCE